LQSKTGAVKKNILEDFDASKVTTGAVGFILTELTYILPLLSAYDSKM
jgi:hypothetical protein